MAFGAGRPCSLTQKIEYKEAIAAGLQRLQAAAAVPAEKINPPRRGDIRQKMPPKPLFPAESPVAQRQPKTDRLVLDRFLKTAANDKRLEESELRAAHAVLARLLKVRK